MPAVVTVTSGDVTVDFSNAGWSTRKLASVRSLLKGLPWLKAERRSEESNFVFGLKASAGIVTIGGTKYNVNKKGDRKKVAELLRRLLDES